MALALAALATLAWGACPATVPLVPGTNRLRFCFDFVAEMGFFLSGKFEVKAGRELQNRYTPACKCYQNAYYKTMLILEVVFM